MGRKNPMWKGDRVSHKPLHAWVRRRMQPTEFCEYCHKKKPIDLMNVTGKYTRELINWLFACRSCHMKRDGRIHNLRNQ